MQKIAVLIFTVFTFLHTSAQTNIGDTAFNIVLKNVKDSLISYKNIKAKVIIIDFWASWCGPCIKEMPNLKKYYTANKIKGLEVFSVNVDDDKKDWKKALKILKTTWTNVNSPGNFDSKTLITWNVEQLPSIWVLNSNGVVLAKGFKLNNLKGIIDAALNNK